jgi:hypothetical protein
MLRSIRLAALVVAVACLSTARADAAGRPRRAAQTSCPAWRPCGPWFANRIIPQGGYGVDFRPACQRHDDCYLTPGASRKACDLRFLADLRAICAASGNPRGCNRRARVYYVMVRLFGGVARSVEEALP